MLLAKLLVKAVGTVAIIWVFLAAMFILGCSTSRGPASVSPDAVQEG